MQPDNPWLKPTRQRPRYGAQRYPFVQQSIGHWYQPFFLDQDCYALAQEDNCLFREFLYAYLGSAIDV